MTRRGGLLMPLLLVAAGLVLVLLAWRGLRLQPAAAPVVGAPAVAASTTTYSSAPVTDLAAQPAVVITRWIENPTATVALDPTAAATATREPTRVATEAAGQTAPTVIAPTLRPSDTPAPVPTFTPPAVSGITLAMDEHYWLQRPIPAGYANWTDRIYPYGSTRGGSFRTHHGVEFINPVGVPVVAAAAGVVVTGGADNQVLFGPQADFYGNLVVIRHDQLYGDQFLYTLYGHLSQVLVSEGQAVAAGETIGLVGGTGVANGGAHLHFEVRVGANSYEATRNPELWLQPFPGWGTIAGRVVWPDGSPVYEAPLSIQRADDPSLWARRTVYTYADESVTPDDVLGENFSSPDVEPGPYVIILNTGSSTQRELVWVLPGRTSFVTIQVAAGPTPEP